MDRFLYQGIAEPIGPPVPPIDAWQPAAAEPVRRRPWPIAPVCVDPGSPTTWRVPTGWLFVPPEPVRRPPRRPDGGQAYPGNPDDWPTPEVITVDKWYRRVVDPVRRPPPWPTGGAVEQSPPELFPFEARFFPFPPIANPLPRAQLWRQRPADVVDPGPWRTRHYLEARGKYRVFAPAVYRFYRSNTGPPSEDDAPFATSATLPSTPADTYADGTWYVAVSYFNGLYDSGFLPIGPHGETYTRLEIAGGAVAGNPPAGPADWRLQPRPGGVVRVLAMYWETGVLRAGQWSIGYTVDGSDPAEDTPDQTQEIAAAGFAVLEYDLPAQADGTTVKVRLQTRRNDGDDETPAWVYSDDSTIQTATADAAGPSAPPSADRWPGIIQ